MRGGVFSVLCGALLLAQDVLAQEPVAIAGSKTPKWVMRQEGGSNYACKCYPGDYCWPNKGQFQKLNNTVGGNLQVHIPPGAPCYNKFDGPLGEVNTYNAAECQKVTSNWNDEQFQ
jgi:hypothetical protein